MKQATTRDRDSIISRVRVGVVRSFKDLAKAVGERWSAEWEGGLRDGIPGLADLIFSNELSKRAEDARLSGDGAGEAAARRAMMLSISSYLDKGIRGSLPAGLPIEVAAAVGGGAEAPAGGGENGGSERKPVAQRAQRAQGAQREPRVSKPKSGPSGLIPLADGEVKGKVMPGLVMGAELVPVRGRKVIWVRRVPGIFGTREGGRSNPQRCTLRDGFVNQCDMHDPPTPYWAAFDAASGFKGEFTREQVVEEAVKALGKGAQPKAVGIAWDVLKNHQHHPRKRDCGMGFVVDTLPGGKMRLRPRDEAETQQYFEAQKSRAKEGDIKVPKLATGPRPKRGDKQREPTEGRPVAVVVDRAKKERV